MRYSSDRRLVIGSLGLFSYSYNILVSVTQVSQDINGYKLDKRPAQENASK